MGLQAADLDEGVLELADEIRTEGLTRAVLTKETDTIPNEVVALGLTNRFDAIFNSADSGFAKPDVRAFQHVLDALGVGSPGVCSTPMIRPRYLPVLAPYCRSHVGRRGRLDRPRSIRFLEVFDRTGAHRVTARAEGGVSRFAGLRS